MFSLRFTIRAVACVGLLTACGSDGHTSKGSVDDGGADAALRAGTGGQAAARDASAGETGSGGSGAGGGGSFDAGASDAADASDASVGDARDGAALAPPWLVHARIVVEGGGAASSDCRSTLCPHNEDTDLIAWNGAIWLVYRTAVSHVPAANSSLRIYRSDDGAETFTPQAILPAPSGRDIRAPHFFVLASELHLQALSRLPVASTRDSNVDTLSVVSTSANGTTWSAFSALGPSGQSFWRTKEHDGVWYAAAYADGDTAVTLYSSSDGSLFAKAADVYTVSADTPTEAELSFLPSGRLLALVRLDGTDAELLGTTGRLRTKLCWASPPYASFSCSDELNGERLDGPASFFSQGRLFVVAREHLPPSERKRSALYELTGAPDAGTETIRRWGDLPSAGDTSYAGVAALDATHVAVSWYSGDVTKDEAWTASMLSPTDIWASVIDMTKLQ